MADWISIDHLLSLIDQYWDLAYAEGSEGRSHDTIDGDAQRVRSEIESAIRGLVSQQRPGSMVNSAHITAADSPAEVVKKLDAAFASLASFRGFMVEGDGVPKGWTNYWDNDSATSKDYQP